MNVDVYPQDRWDNNPTIWELEKRYHLSTFRKTDDGLFKVFTPLTNAQADKIEQDIRSKYVTRMGTPALDFQKVASGDNNSRYTGLRLKGWFRDPYAHDLLLEVERAVRREVLEMEQETGIDVAPLHKLPETTVKTAEDLGRILDVNSIIEDIIDPYSVLDQLFFKDSNTKAIVEALKARKEANPNLKINVINRKDIMNEDMLDALMYYHPAMNTIHVVREASESPVANSYDFYANAIVHEFIHSFTVQAVLKPQSELDVGASSGV